MADITPAEERFYSVQQIADKLNIHFRTVYNLIYTGQLSSIRVGRVYRVSEFQFYRFLRSEDQTSHFKR